MTVMRNTNFEQSSNKSFLDIRDRFKTFCNLTDGKCVFLIHVPELRRFTPDAKAMLGREAWWTAELLLDKNKIGKPDTKLAVGIKGVINYDRVITGRFVPGAKNETVGIENVLEGQGCERELFGWFDEANSNSDQSSVSNASALNQSQHH
jgi:hypothetical protein